MSTQVKPTLYTPLCQQWWINFDFYRWSVVFGSWVSEHLLIHHGHVKHCICHLMLQGDGTQAPIADWLGVQMDISSPRGHVNEIREWCTAGRILDGHVRHHKDKVLTPVPRIYAVTFRLLVPHLEAFSGYKPSGPELLQPSVEAQRYPLPTVYLGHPLRQQHHRQTQSEWCRRHIRWRIRKCWSVMQMKAVFASAEVMNMLGMRSVVYDSALTNLTCWENW